MNFRKVMIGLLAAALVGSFSGVAQTVDAGDAAGTATSFAKHRTPLYDEVDTDEIVEGHTVYKRIEDTETPQAAIAILVENETLGEVLWFDDTFLHNPERQLACGGSVWATHSKGVLLPRDLYQEDKTYRITTPSEQTADGTVTWTITEFEGPAAAVGGSPLTRAWGVEVKCAQEEPDEGYKTGPFPTFCGPNGGIDDCNSNPDNNLGEPDAESPSDIGILEYNAFLWFEFGFGHLGPAEQFVNPVQFGCTNQDTGDNNGREDLDEPCGADAETHDTTEGNSHPYNGPHTAGDGTTTDPNGDSEHNEDDFGEPAPIHDHSTAQVDLYYVEDDNVAHGDVDFTNNLEQNNFHDHHDE